MFSDIRLSCSFSLHKGAFTAKSGDNAAKGEKQCPGIIKAVVDRGAIMVAVVAQALRGEEEQGAKEAGKHLPILTRSSPWPGKTKELVTERFGGWKAGILIALVLLGIWAANGFYRVQPNQEGVPVLLGRFVGTTTNQAYIGTGRHQLVRSTLPMLQRKIA